MYTRSPYLLGSFAIVVLLSISIYLQFFDGFNPCPLCSLQRISFALLGVFFFIGIFLYKQRISRILINLFLLASSLIGALLAGRQIWLQHFPPLDNTECGVSLQYMMQVLPMNEVAKKILAGSAECTQNGWTFLWFNMAEWSLLWFLIFLAGSVYLLFKNNVRDKKYLK